VDTARPPANVRLVPDLDDELLRTIDQLEALLASLAVWEMEDDVGLPAPFAGQEALRALEAVADVVRPTQGRDEQQLVSGRLPRCGWTGRLLALRFVPIAEGPLRILERAMEVLSVQRAYQSLNAAVEQYAAVVGEPPIALVSCLSRTVSVLTLPCDDDVRKLWESATASPAKCDTELSRSEQQAYDRVVNRIDHIWSYRPGVGRQRALHASDAPWSLGQIRSSASVAGEHRTTPHDAAVTRRGTGLGGGES
jgi:hypothetical protein